MTLVTPLLSSEYELFELLGEGGMGAVYRARHRRLGHDVAIKLLRSLAEEDQARFRREASVMASLAHPRIVRVLDAHLEGEAPYLVTELMRCDTLEQRQQREALTAPEAVRVCAEVAEALEFLHGRGLMHRDVKPANVFVDAEHGARLADFGLARTVAAGQTVTRAGTIVGTPDFMAPEQVDGGEVTPAVDQYALGVMLFLLLTGDVPFTGGTPLETLCARTLADAPSVAARRPDLPRELVAAVARVLARDPAARYPSMQAVREALEALAGQVPGDGAVGRRPRSASAPTVVRGRDGTRPAADRARGGPLTSANAPPARAVSRKGEPASFTAYGLVLALGLLAMGAFVWRFDPYPRPVRDGAGSTASPLPSPAVESATPAATGTPAPGQPIYFRLWRSVEPLLVALERGEPPVPVIRELEQRLPGIAFGRDPGAWLYWRELGRWAEHPDRPPPLPRDRSHSGTMPLEAQIPTQGALEHRKGPLTASTTSEAISELYHFAAPGRIWLALGRILESEGLAAAALRAYERGVLVRPDALQDIDWEGVPCEGLVRALVLLPGHDLVREWSSWICGGRVAHRGWRGLRQILAQDRPTLCESMLRAGMSSPDGCSPGRAGAALADLQDEHHDAPEARRTWQLVRRLDPENPDPRKELVQIAIRRGELEVVDALLPKADDPSLTAFVEALRNPTRMPMEFAEFSPKQPPEIVRTIAFSDLEARDIPNTELVFSLYRDRIRPREPAFAGVWLAFGASRGTKDPAFEHLRLHLAERPANWRLWSEATGAFAVSDGGGWMKERLAQTADWASGSDRALVRALWAARTGQHTAALAALDEALKRNDWSARPSPAVLIDPLVRAQILAALGKAVPPATLAAAAKLTIAADPAWPAGFNAALAQFQDLLHAKRWSELAVVARTLFDYDPEEPIWGQCAVLAEHLAGNRPGALRWLERVAFSRRTFASGLWALHELRSIVAN